MNFDLLAAFLCGLYDCYDTIHEGARAVRPRLSCLMAYTICYHATLFVTRGSDFAFTVQMNDLLCLDGEQRRTRYIPTN